MASETRKFEVTLPLETWKKMKRLCDTGRGKNIKTLLKSLRLDLRMSAKLTTSSKSHDPSQ